MKNKKGTENILEEDLPKINSVPVFATKEIFSQQTHKHTT